MINVTRDYRFPHPLRTSGPSCRTFCRNAFGWRSKDPALAASGAALLLEKESPSIEQVDSPSGAIGTAVNHAIETCAKIIAGAPVDNETRVRWLERLWEAHQNDEIRASSTWPTAGASCGQRAIELPHGQIG
jgi:hypothetical protein